MKQTITNLNANDSVLRAGDFPLVQLPIKLEAGNGIILANTVLGRISISKNWAPYDEDSFDGTEIARAILVEGRDTSNGEVKAFAYRTGIFNPLLLVGLDQKAIEDLEDRSIFMNGVFTS